MTWADAALVALSGWLAWVLMVFYALLKAVLSIPFDDDNPDP